MPAYFKYSFLKHGGGIKYFTRYCGNICKVLNYHFNANLLENQQVKEFWKLVLDLADISPVL